MNLQERQTVFNKGLASYRFGRLDESCSEFRKLLDDGSSDPKHLSYYGLLLATTEGKLKEGLALCERAILLDFYNPEMHLNLSQVLLANGSRNRAIVALLRGIRLAPQDRRLHVEIRRLNPRSRPVVPFLRRNHPVNKYLGMLRSRLTELVS